jgi:methyltransferase family protein
MNSRVRQVVKALLPDPAVQRIQRKLAERASRPRSIDDRAARLIREASLSELRDAAFLERELLPRLGFNDELLHEFPSSLYPHTGRGLLHWQYPNQFSKYLAELSRLEIETYLEIGVRHGGTFVITVEYLSRFRPVRKAIGVDLERPPGLVRYAKSRPGATVLEADSQTEEFRELVRAEGPFDLVLIDGDHSEAGCRRDFETVSDHARIIVFHDIVSDPVPGVGAVWREVKQTYPDRFRFLEFTDQYPELAEQGKSYLGIGVAIAGVAAARG